MNDLDRQMIITMRIFTQHHAWNRKTPIVLELQTFRRLILELVEELILCKHSTYDLRVEEPICI